MTTPQDKFRELKGEYEALFSSPVGQKILADIKKSAGVEKEIFNSDAMVMAHSEGKRQLGIHLIYMATPSPEEKKIEART
jgi:hypothetical protein